MASRGLEALVEEARMVANNGVREVVVTGICVGAYRDGDRTLPDLLRAVADLPGSERVRLSSIQPIEVDDRLIDAVASHPNICPHLHLSLQSGSDGVLAAMRRPYDTAFYRGIVAKLRTRVPSIAITTDIIVGFPGETDADFETSAAFAREMAFARIHVFRYSPRKRTFAAENLRDDVSAEQKDARHAALSAIGAQTQADFARKLVGQTVDVLVERGGRGDGYRVGYTSSYVRVNFTCGNEIAPGQIVPVRISEIDDSGDCIGRI